MADRIAFPLNDATTGAPLTGAVPTFVQYRDLLGNARTPPVITELGAGLYGFSPTDADEAARVAFLLDGGAGANPRRFSGAIHTPRTPFIAWHLEDAAGALWAGASPSFGLYDDFSGNARVAPPIITPGATTYLFAAVPSTADLAIDVAFRADSPAGAEPPDFTGSLEAQPGWRPARARCETRPPTLPRSSTARPRAPADASTRGTFWYSRSAGGAADTIQICLKSAANTYSWVTIGTG